MRDKVHRAVAVVGVGAVLPDAPNAPTFWNNVKAGRYSISETRGGPGRWDPALYYDPDPKATDKTYSKIGGWVTDYPWDPMSWRLPIPPKVADGMDLAQKWSIAAVREALTDYGWPNRPLDRDRTAVILGNAMAGDKHYLTAMRVFFPEFATALEGASSFQALPSVVRDAIVNEARTRMQTAAPAITEDTMPGELANIIAGRVAAVFDFHGPNYIVDAACASAMAAINAAIEGLEEGDYDAVVTGGIDANMSAASFVKFCKIGALSATGTRPYDKDADGFVMGEGAAVFVLKRLDDAEADGDTIYAVIRGMGGASDGRGKGITAPNPVGQRLAIQRAWAHAGEDPGTCTLIEGHGTSTRVGDVVEVQSMAEALGPTGAAIGSIPIGSVKSNIGHLKGAAGAAGILKAVFALRDKIVPPSLGVSEPNPKIDFARLPFYPNTVLREWDHVVGDVRRAGVSAFGFGGTNFHAVLEEHVPGRLDRKRGQSVAVPGTVSGGVVAASVKAPPRGALALGARSPAALRAKVDAARASAATGRAPVAAAPAADALAAAHRLVVDYSDSKDLTDKLDRALRALDADNPAMWRALRAKGVFRGTGAAPKVAFLYTGQGSQYVNMLAELREREPIVRATFDEADEVMTPLLGGRSLSSIIFADAADELAQRRAADELKQTAITQPAVLTTDIAITRLLAAYGVTPDMVMGHSLGEYGALVASGAMSFNDALEAVSARGREMTKVSVADNGLMAAVLAPLDAIQRLIASIDDYVVIANLNSNSQAVVGGSTPGVRKAIAAIEAAGHRAIPLPVSHAFHTRIVAPASEPLRVQLGRLGLQSPRIPIVANVSGEFYPMGADVVPEMIDILAHQIASPVQFVKGLSTLYDAGARVFIEVGPKAALVGFVDDVLGARGDISALFTNHPKVGDMASINQALCGLYAAGLGTPASAQAGTPEPRAEAARVATTQVVPPAVPRGPAPRAMTTPPPPRAAAGGGDHFAELGRMFAGVLERGMALYGRGGGGGGASAAPVTITGAGLGLPGGNTIFGDDKVPAILRGDSFIDAIPLGVRRQIIDKHITRLVKADNGEARFVTLGSPAESIKLAGRGGEVRLVEDFGFAEDRAAAMDSTTQMAVAVGLEALRDAGIPLVLRYKTTSKGTQLPDRWMLPEALRDDTGIIFGSAFPGYDAYAEQMEEYYADQHKRRELADLEQLLARVAGETGSVAVREVERRVHDLRTALEQSPHRFDRRFVFRILSMGHSQLAEYIGARGPNTQINSACASGTQAMALAEDWIRAGRCRRVVIVTADNVTSDHLLEWVGAGFLATGAAATDEVLEEVALPFDRRRHGLLLGMGASGVLVESAEAAAERGIRPIAELLSSVTANSAFHGTRLDVEHIGSLMEKLVAEAEAKHGIDRHAIAPHTVFMSHETYTPARGGSASAEVHALRRVFGSDADQIVVANTKGMTGHAMGAGIEDAVAIKILETSLVPPVANYKEVDPELGRLNLSRGGSYPVHYALRLGAGFGSQVSLSLVRWVPSADGRRPAPHELGYEQRIDNRPVFEQWLADVAGVARPELEVANRTLRIKDGGLAARAARTAAAAQPPGAAAAPVAAPTPVVAPAPVAAPAPAPAPAAPAAAPPATDPVVDRVLAIVAAQTGYPPDMLDPELDLEADLGIDTVKQAETFAAVREAYGLPRDENLQLREFPTLGHVVGWVRSKRPDLAGPAPATASAQVAAAPAAAPEVAVPGATSDPVLDRVLGIVAKQTGYPPDMLDPDLDLEADLGIDTVKQAETFAAVREAYEIPRDENLQLRDFPTLALVVGWVKSKRPDLAVPAVAAAPAAAPAVAAAPAPAPAETSNDAIAARVLGIVAERTGYPPDMLDLDLDLEADLGIDTVKQAETFAAVREAYNLPRDENLQLREFPTLNLVIGWVKDKLAAVTPAAKPAAVESDQPAAADDGDDAAVRRVPVPILRPPLEACKSTGVELGAGARVVVQLDRGGVGQALVQRLERRGVEVLAFDDAPSADDHVARLQAWAAAGPISGVYWLSALDPEGDIASLSAEAWRGAIHRRIKLLFATMKSLYEQNDGRGAFLVAGTRFGGRFGCGVDGALDALGGPVAGFVKTYKRERPDTLAKVIDQAPSRKTAAIAERLIEETLRDPGAVEIGYADDERWTVAVRPRDADAARPELTLGPESVYVVTGAAGSIVSAIITDLARTGGQFHLLDLAPEPDPTDPDLALFARDKEALKRELVARMKAESSERVTPAMVERRVAGLERQRAALSAIEAIRAAGGSAVYHQLDLRDGGAVGAAIDRVRAAHGRIDALLHCAGLEISHFLPSKSASEFDLVFDVKADGWYHLMHAIGDMPLGAAVVFSSIAGRFGNAGQADYSAANELLTKSVSSFRASRPATRGIAVDWTAWADIGMASRGSIPKMMALAGIDMLRPQDGIPVVRRELEAGTTSELVLGGRLGILLDEWDATGGLDVSSLDARPRGLMVARAVAMGVYRGLEVETELDPTSQPFLFDHRIGGTPVLPGVMGMEAFCEVARTLFPDWHLAAIEGVSFLAPFKFYRDQPRLVTIQAQLERDGDEIVANCRLIGRRVLVGSDVPKETTHFTATVRLSREPATNERADAPPAQAARNVQSRDIYGVYFHGPAYQVLDSAWRENGFVVGRMRTELPTHHSPPELPTVTDPRLVELCFQTAGVWEIGTTGRMGLPEHIDRVSVLRAASADDGALYAVVTPREDGKGFDAYVTDEAGNRFVVLEGYRTSALPGDIDPDKRAPLRTAME